MMPLTCVRVFMILSITPFIFWTWMATTSLPEMQLLLEP